MSGGRLEYKSWCPITIKKVKVRGEELNEREGSDRRVVLNSHSRPVAEVRGEADVGTGHLTILL